MGGAATATEQASGTVRACLSGPRAASHRQAAAPIRVAINTIVTQGVRAIAGTSPSTYANAIRASIGVERIRPLGYVSSVCTSGPRWAYTSALEMSPASHAEHVSDRRGPVRL